MRKVISGFAAASVSVLLCSTAILLSGCDGSTNTRLGALEKRSTAQEARINELEWKTGPTNPSAKLMAGDSGYSRIDTGVGMFFVYLKSAERYKDGFNLVVCIGNPGNMTVHGGQMQIIWGKGPDKTRSFSFAQRLEPGLWNEVEAFITPADKEDVKSMTMSLNVSNISLLGNRE